MFKQIVSAFTLACALAPINPARADVDVGAYLAGRQAGADNDFVAGARYFTKGLMADPTDAYILENAMTSFVAVSYTHLTLPTIYSV